MPCIPILNRRLLNACSGSPKYSQNDFPFPTYLENVESESSLDLTVVGSAKTSQVYAAALVHSSSLFNIVFSFSAHELSIQIFERLAGKLLMPLIQKYRRISEWGCKRRDIKRVNLVIDA